MTSISSASLPGAYWETYEGVVGDLGSFIDAARTIAAYQQATGARFAWRGVAAADWGLHSSLFRRFKDREGHRPTEPQLVAYERQVLLEARTWALDWHPEGGRLTGLELLARLQHHGAPTRMLDFTFNPLVALWFASSGHPSEDGRLFAIDVSNKSPARTPTLTTDPWWLRSPASRDWQRDTWVWRPPPFEPRIIRQDGCFLVGGVPSTQPARNVSIAGTRRLLLADEVRQCMSVPLVLISFEQAEAASQGRSVGGATPRARAFTLRVTRAGKQAISRELERTFGYSHASLFPDPAGFAAHALAASAVK